MVTKDNYTLAIIRHFLNPGLTHVVIPVIYNTCVDFGEELLSASHSEPANKNRRAGSNASS